MVGPVVVAGRGGGDPVEAAVHRAVVAVELLRGALVVHVAEVQHAVRARRRAITSATRFARAPPSAPSPTAHTWPCAWCRRRDAGLRPRRAVLASSSPANCAAATAASPPPTPTRAARESGGGSSERVWCASSARRLAPDRSQRSGLQLRCCRRGSSCGRAVRQRATCAPTSVPDRDEQSPSRTASSRTSRAAPPGTIVQAQCSLSAASMPWESDPGGRAEHEQASARGERGPSRFSVIHQATPPAITIGIRVAWPHTWTRSWTASCSAVISSMPRNAKTPARTSHQRRSAGFGAPHNAVQQRQRRRRRAAAARRRSRGTSAPCSGRTRAGHRRPGRRSTPRMPNTTSRPPKPISELAHVQARHRATRRSPGPARAGR